MLLMLFSSDPHHARLAESAGIDAVVVDLEHKGKSDRQKGFDLEINDHTPEHVSRIRECSSITIVARVNAVSEDSAGEIDEVLAAGADYVMLPMARSSRDAGRFLGGWLRGGRKRLCRLRRSRCFTKFTKVMRLPSWIGTLLMRASTISWSPRGNRFGIRW